MLPILKSFFREFFKILWLCGRYVGVCAIMMLISLSLATGKFPPPIKEVYKSFSSVRSSMNIAETTENFAKAQEQQRQILAAIEDKPSRPTQNGQVNVNLVTDKERIQSLEYEVAMLKSKLARAQQETRQLEIRQASAQR
jgi:hypothetical protein